MTLRRFAPLLLLPVAAVAWGQTADLAPTTDDLNVLVAFLSGGSGSGVVAGGLLLACRMGWVTLGRPADTGAASSHVAAHVADLHKVAMRRGENEQLHWPETLTQIHERVTATEHQISALVASSTASNAALSRVAAALEALVDARAARADR